MSSTSFNKLLRKLAVLIVWLVLWQILSLLINNVILLAGPIATAKALISLIKTSTFWVSIARTSAFIAGGFAIGIFSGIILAVLSYRIKIVKEFFEPFIHLMKSIPVASFVVIVLVWSGSKFLALIISSIVVMPIIYINTLQGLTTADTKLLEMAKVFGFNTGKIVKNIYLPSLKPFILSSFSLASGMAWKSGIAAELIGQPLSTLGNGLYRAKVFLMTDSMFAWTIVAILLAFIFEKLVMLIVRRIFK